LNSYARGHLPLSFNNLWITREAHRAQATPMVLRNDAEFFIPFLRLTQTSLLPYYCFPRIWKEFDQLNLSLAFLRDKNEFNTELKKYLIQKTVSLTLCSNPFQVSMFISRFMIQILHNIQNVQEGKIHQIFKLPNLCENQL
jgi:hypothetical protein